LKPIWILQHRLRRLPPDISIEATDYEIYTLQSPSTAQNSTFQNDGSLWTAVNQGFPIA